MAAKFPFHQSNDTDNNGGLLLISAGPYKYWSVAQAHMGFSPTKNKPNKPNSNKHNNTQMQKAPLKAPVQPHDFALLW